MDYIYNYRDSISQRKPVSILEGDEFCVNKILARDSSVGRSSRIYYRSTNEGVGVPFKWEMQPGTPKTPPTEEMIPPPTPPPAILSLGLGLPHPNLDYHTKESRRWRFWFWKRSKKRQEKHKALTLRGNYKRSVTTTNGGDHGVSSDHEFEGFHEFGDSDGEFTTSVHDSRSSSSSSSSSNGIHLGTRIRGVPLFCSPWQH